MIFEENYFYIFKEKYRKFSELQNCAYIKCFYQTLSYQYKSILIKNV